MVSLFINIQLYDVSQIKLSQKVHFFLFSLSVFLLEEIRIRERTINKDSKSDIQTKKLRYQSFPKGDNSIAPPTYKLV